MTWYLVHTTVKIKKYPSQISHCLFDGNYNCVKLMFLLSFLIQSFSSIGNLIYKYLVWKMKLMVKTNPKTKVMPLKWNIKILLMKLSVFLITHLHISTFLVNGFHTKFLLRFVSFIIPWNEYGLPVVFMIISKLIEYNKEIYFLTI